MKNNSYEKVNIAVHPLVVVSKEWEQMLDKLYLNGEPWQASGKQEIVYFEI